MAFWWTKKTPNEDRASDPEGFDLAAEINRKAEELRRVAAKDSSRWSDGVVALQTALGSEVAAEVLRGNPGFSRDQMLYTMDQILDRICPGVREAAYIAANLPVPPQVWADRDLTTEEFNGLTTRLINEATKNNISVNDALSATAKALGSLICFFAEREGISAEDLIKLSHDAVEQFAGEAMAFRANDAAR